MRAKVFILAGIILILLGVGGYLLRSKLKPTQAGLQIETSPAATVYLNDEQLGTTPYDALQGSGEISLRLVPIATEGKSLAPWGSTVTLTPGIKTVVKRDFAETESQSAGEILSFEKISGNDASMAVVASTDSSQVSIDGEIRGFTPLPVESIPVGEHRIVVSQPGYKEREILVHTEAGYKLTVVAMLAQSEVAEASSSAASTDKEEASEQVEILETPTGFLRVRIEPSASASEAAKVNPGKKYAYVDQDKSGTWYKIEYEKGKEGWISAQYAKKTE